MPARSRVVEELLARALASSGGETLHASSVALFARSPFAAWCDRFAPADARDPTTDFQRLLMEQGREHEARIVARSYPDAQRVTYATEEEGFRAALEGMASGVRVLHGAPLLWLPEGLRGRVDLLERRDDAPSVFGAHSYVVKEIKLAKNLKDDHRLQASFYNHLLGRIQGRTPATFTLVNRDGEETVIAHDEPEMLATLRALRAVRAGERPDPVHGAGAWPWETYTDRCAKEARDVSLVAGVGPESRALLAAAGFARVDALATAPLDALTAIRGVGDKKARRFRANARAIVEDRHLRVGPVSIPPVATEIFLDLEGTGAQDTGAGLVEIDYLIGALVRRDGKESYHAFVAHTLDGEGDMFHAFVAWLSTLDGYALYHWSPYEATHMKRLVARHGLAPELHARLFGNLRDLYKDATQAFAFPAPSTSIKAIAPYMGFQWRHKGVNAMESIAMYLAYAQDPVAHGESLRLVQEYNEDDCVAMRVVKDWLLAHADEPLVRL